jgi:hypothetical protein
MKEKGREREKKKGGGHSRWMNGKLRGEREGWNNKNAGKEAERKRHDRRKKKRILYTYTQTSVV